MNIQPVLGVKAPHVSPPALRWALGIGAASMVALGLVLLFLLAQATNNRELYERNYERLLILNVAVAAALLAVIFWIVWRLVSRLRRGKFGSRLLVKLAAIFALVGVVPGMLIYVVSYQFVSRSIESWFDVKVEGALDAGLNLGRTTLEVLSNDLASKSRSAATQLADAPEATVGLSLERLREQLSASDIKLWSAAGYLIASSGESRFQINPERPSLAQLRMVRSLRVVSQIEGLEERLDANQGVALQGPPVTEVPPRIRVLAIVTSNKVGLLAEPRYLQVTQDLPAALVSNALAVQAVYSEYQERALARNGLRRMYIGTLTLSLFLAVFGAVLLAVLLGNQLARPLLLLADGVRQVAEGDLRPKSVLQSRDELGGLTRSFAQMTLQLSDARAAVEKSMGDVSAARAKLQTILDNLTAGVVVLDEQGHILSSNPGASRILRVPLAAHEGKTFAQIPELAVFGQKVQSQFDAFLGERNQHDLDHWQQSFELNTAEPEGHQHTVTLVARGAHMLSDARLLVLDDISEIVSAQRTQAWAEVARRLAHEIKNPLTPIQLSAERMEAKLKTKLSEPDQLLLSKSVKTIVDQVDAMKRLVNEFRDYARLPAAELKALDLNALITEILLLYSDESTLVPITAVLDPDCPQILGDSQQLRQVVHNLIQNAQDAVLAAKEISPISTFLTCPIIIKTRWNEAGKKVRLSVQDSGGGFAQHILNRAFEPYVTTKVKGTGLGLAVVKKIADEHGARVDLSNRVEAGVLQGAQVSLSFAIAPTPLV
ncbi:MAG: ATP-binding protein [Burkholderiaceae bacterium]